jgi:hypothetical protein
MDKTGTELRVKEPMISVLELMDPFGLFLRKLPQEDIRFTDHLIKVKSGTQPTELVLESVLLRLEKLLM